MKVGPAGTPSGGMLMQFSWKKWKNGKMGVNPLAPVRGSNRC
jgi:hypothetical protein